MTRNKRAPLTAAAMMMYVFLERPDDVEVFSVLILPFEVRTLVVVSTPPRRTLTNSACAAHERLTVVRQQDNV
jgi:hypothetical protein